MKFCTVNKLKIVNRFVLHTLHRNIKHSAVTTLKTTEKIKIMKCEGKWKRADKTLFR